MTLRKKLKIKKRAYARKGAFLKANKTALDIGTLMELYQLDATSQKILAQWLTSISDLRQQVKKKMAAPVEPQEGKTDGQEK